MKWTVFLLLFLSSAKSEAVLSPFYESIVEIKTILDDPRLNDALKTAMPIDKIEKISNGWKIEADRNEVIVHIVPLPQNRPGPQQFELDFQNK